MSNIKIISIASVVFMNINAVFGASCATDYVVATHTVDLDFNINNPEYPNVITGANKALGTATFITSDDGNCYTGYEPYTKTGNDLYPLIEDSDLCSDGYYRSNGNCVAFTSGGCPTGRYNSAVTSTTFVASEDGSCYTGFDVYNHPGDDVYPLVDAGGNNSIVLCPEGQYMANGTCKSYPTGTCPENMKNTTVNSATWALKTGSTCPSNYTEHTFSTIEYACDTWENHITTDTGACTLMCDNGKTFTEVDTCASPCTASYTGATPGSHRVLRISNGLVFPLYSEKQTTPSLNFGINNNVCYVNLVPGQTTRAIHIDYNGTIYHTVK